MVVLVAYSKPISTSQWHYTKNIPTLRETTKNENFNLSRKYVVHSKVQIRSIPCCQRGLLSYSTL